MYGIREIPAAKARLEGVISMLGDKASSFLIAPSFVGGACFGSWLDSTCGAAHNSGLSRGQCAPIAADHVLNGRISNRVGNSDAAIGNRLDIST